MDETLQLICKELGFAATEFEFMAAEFKIRAIRTLDDSLMQFAAHCASLATQAQSSVDEINAALNGDPAGIDHAYAEAVLAQSGFRFHLASHRHNMKKSTPPPPPPVE